MPPEPTHRIGTLDSGAKVIAAATGCEKRRVDALDVDAAIYHGLDAVGDLQPVT